jgi:hypothetical protein
MGTNRASWRRMPSYTDACSVILTGQLTGPPIGVSSLSSWIMDGRSTPNQGFDVGRFVVSHSHIDRLWAPPGSSGDPDPTNCPALPTEGYDSRIQGSFIVRLSLEGRPTITLGKGLTSYTLSRCPGARVWRTVGARGGWVC